MLLGFFFQGDKGEVGETGPQGELVSRGKLTLINN